MVEAFAMVKETCRRMIGQSWRISGQQAEWNMVPYDVQLLVRLFAQGETFLK